MSLDLTFSKVGPNLDKDVKNLMTIVGRQIILPTFGRLSAQDISVKGVNDVVTIIDQKSESYLTHHLSRLLSGSNVVGEEAVAENPDVLNFLNQDGPVWVIDPLDGTRNYIEGRSDFALMIALIKDDRVYAGWIYDILQDEFAWAFLGNGCWYKNHRMLLPKGEQRGHKKMSGSIPYRLRHKWQTDHLPEDLPVIIKSSLCCAGQDYLRLITNQLDFVTFGHSNSWDHAAGSLMYREAGGLVYNWSLTAAYSPRQRGGGIIAAPNLECLQFLSRQFEFIQD